MYISQHSILFFSFLLIFFIVIAVITKPRKSTTKHDISAIAGDDVISTQLDLAKAYIEMDQKELAKEILAEVRKLGSSEQKTQAQHLLKALL